MCIRDRSGPVGKDTLFSDIYCPFHTHTHTVDRSVSTDWTINVHLELSGNRLVVQISFLSGLTDRVEKSHASLATLVGHQLAV